MPFQNRHLIRLEGFHQTLPSWNTLSITVIIYKILMNVQLYSNLSDISSRVRGKVNYSKGEVLCKMVRTCRLEPQVMWSVKNTLLHSGKGQQISSRLTVADKSTSALPARLHMTQCTRLSDKAFTKYIVDELQFNLMMLKKANLQKSFWM